MLFPQNLGPHLSIDEVAVTNGELWTTLTNKAAHGKKGALVAMIQGTKASDIAQVVDKLPASARAAVTEVTLDMAANMELAVKHSFPRAKLVTDRFHVQQLVSEAVQDIRIELRRAALKEENDHMKQARKKRKPYIPVVYENGDTPKQLLARSRYLLFKPQSKWKTQQTERAGILFREYPQLRVGYNLSMMFRACYEHSTSIPEAREKLQAWYRKVEEKTMDTFLTAAESIRLHEPTILNYFMNRSTNASAESFNAKLKNFRALVRGVRDKKFHLFRIAKLYG
jgi:transposase